MRAEDRIAGGRVGNISRGNSWRGKNLYNFGNPGAGDRDRTGDIQLGKMAEN
jgi:hypothetical protein